MVSVIIPTYNRRDYIVETVASVLAQTYHNLEVVVVDDGSTDGTGDYLKHHYGSEDRLRYIWQENAERSVARNTGIKAAQGELVAFLDSDDLWLPTKLEKQVARFEADPEFVMVHTGWCQYYEDKSTRPFIFSDKACCEGNILGALVSFNRIGSPTPLVRRWVFDKVGGFNVDKDLIYYGEDWEMWTRVSSLGPVGYIPEVLAMRRIHHGNTERCFTPLIYKRFVEGVMRTLDRSQREMVFTAACQRFWFDVKGAVQRGEIAVARSYFWNGLACLGPRFLLEASRNRWALGNVMFGSRIARGLLSAWRVR